jgi:hypothetical protein
MKNKHYFIITYLFVFNYYKDLLDINIIEEI